MADPTLTSRTPGVAPALRPTAAPATELVRLVDLVAGQRVQATVIEPPALGRVLVGLLGGVVEATTNLPLEVGRSYEFTVSATEPRIVLKAPSPSTLPSPDTAVAAGLLGPAASEIAALVHAVRAMVRTTTGQPAAGGGDPQAALDAAVARLADGAADASDLQTIARRLGHDQEARVLRLPAQPAARELTELRGTLKAQALLLLADAATAETEPARRAAAKLVAGLNHIEADNAARAEQGSPLWLPLPVSGGSFLRDARMFLVGDDERRADATESRPYRIVLLLDLTRLGPLRVDIEVRDARLSATFQVARESSLHRLRPAFAALRSELEAAGLEVRALDLRLAPAGQLPVGDLLSPPRPAQSTSRVDVHV